MLLFYLYIFDVLISSREKLRAVGQSYHSLDIMYQQPTHILQLLGRHYLPKHLNRPATITTRETHKWVHEQRPQCLLK